MSSICIIVLRSYRFLQNCSVFRCALRFSMKRQHGIGAEARGVEGVVEFPLATEQIVLEESRLLTTLLVGLLECAGLVVDEFFELLLLHPDAFEGGALLGGKLAREFCADLVLQPVRM